MINKSSDIYKIISKVLEIKHSLAMKEFVLLSNKIKYYVFIFKSTHNVWCILKFKASYA